MTADSPLEPAPQFDIARSLGSSTYEQPPRPKPELMPWHRPRKQFVRSRQWVGAVRSLLNEKPGASNLTYLGLPGRDLLDLRVFRDECGARNVALGYLGFDRVAKSDSDEAVLLNNNLDNLSRGGVAIDPRSEVLPDELSDLADIRSQARSRAQDFGSFDVVNLDLCGGMINEPVGQLSSMFSGLDGILSIQSGRDDPWVLFITGALDRSVLSGSGREVAERLLRFIAPTVGECKLEALLAQNVDVDVDEIAAVLDVDTCPEWALSRVLALAFAWWIRDIANSRSATSVKFVSSLCYRLSEASPYPQMYSLAFRIVPRGDPAPDPAGLLPPPTPVDHCAVLKAFVERVGRSEDLDRMMQDRPDLLDELRDETSRLLGELDYDIAEYAASDYALPFTVP